MSEVKNIFISHIHEDDDGLNKLKTLVAKHGLTVRDGSINSDKPNNANNHEYIMRDVISPRIEWCGVMVVYITPGTKDSEWVTREIEKAERLGKRIVGVWANGHADCEIPDALRDLHDALVGWDGGRIVDAITGDFSGRECPDGTLIDTQPFARIKCQ